MADPAIVQGALNAEEEEKLRRIIKRKENDEEEKRRSSVELLQEYLNRNVILGVTAGWPPLI